MGNGLTLTVDVVKLAPGVARAQGRDMDVAVVHLKVQAARGLDQKALDRAIQGVATGRGRITGQRGDVEDPPEVAIDHARTEPVGQFNRRDQHDLEHGLMLFPGHRLEPLGAREAGIVDQGIDRTAARLDGLDQARRRGRIGQVLGDDDGFDTGPQLEFIGQRFQPVGPARGQHQIPAMLGIDPRQGLADTGRGPGDQGQSAVSGVRRCHGSVRPRRDGGFKRPRPADPRH